ncbi:MAG: ABC transporter permease [Chitinophagaceae bacterium]
MSFPIAISTELLKTKRSASFWLSIAGAAIIPGIFFLAYTFNPDEIIRETQADAWGHHFNLGWQFMSAFLFPMFVILVCTLIPQIEFKNNTWKQVFASPQSYGNIYFSKFLTIHILIFFFYLLFNVFMILAAVVPNLIYSGYRFFDQSLDWQAMLLYNFKTYISILGISAIMYCVALRFKNFVAPTGIGLALLLGSMIAAGMGWKHVFKLPFSHPILTLKYMNIPNRPFLENHEINSIIYFAVFLLIGFLDMRFRKEKG